MTTEELSTTRLGKYINTLRKSASNSSLAKKAKSLVKKWQKLIPEQMKQVNSSEANLKRVPSDGSISRDNLLPKRMKFEDDTINKAESIYCLISNKPDNVQIKRVSSSPEANIYCIGKMDTNEERKSRLITVFPFTYPFPGL